jgi:hypothetical protein
VRLKAVLACLAAAFAIAAAVLPGTVVAVQPLTCPSGSGNGAGVQIHVIGEGTAHDYWCSADVIQQEATMVGPVPSPTGGPPISNGISIRNLLHLAQILKSAHLVQLFRSNNGTPSHLDRAEIVNPSSSFIGGLPAIVEIAGSQIEYLRPARPMAAARSQADYNSESIVQTQLDLTVFSGPALTVAIASSSTNPQPNKQVQLSASPTGSGLSYTWRFADGTVLHGSTVSHTFTRSGTQGVYVTVRGSGGSAGVASTQLDVQPKAKGGTVPSKKKNKKSGSGTPGNNPGTGNPGGTNNNPAYNYYGNPSTNPTATTPPHTGPRIKSNRLGQQSGTIVRGRLISAVTPVSPAQIASGNVPPPTPINQRIAPQAPLDNVAVKPVAGLLAALAIVLLLSSGAGHERRSLRRSIASARLG